MQNSSKELGKKVCIKRIKELWKKLSGNRQERMRDVARK